MTLVAAMINVAVTELYTEIIAEGTQMRVWQDSQLASLQEQLHQIDLILIVSESFRETLVHDCQFVEELKAANRLDRKRMGSLVGIANSWKKEWQRSDIFVVQCRA